MRVAHWRLMLGGSLLGLALSACGPSSPQASPAPPTRTIRPTVTPTPIPISRWSSASPDGAWIAEGSMQGPWLQGDNEVYRTTLDVRSADGSVAWPVIDQTSHYGLGYTVPVVVSWSTLAPRLYFTHDPVPDGCAMFVTGSDFYALNLIDGSLIELLPPGRTVSFALAPDESTLAFVGAAEASIVFHDLASGEERIADLETDSDTQVGGITWSSEGEAVLLVLAHRPCLEGWAHSVVWVDAATLEWRRLVDRDPRRFTIEAWVSPNPPFLRDDTGMLWSLDLSTGQTTVAVRP